MVQKYQNEISPTFYYGISTKTSEKDLKIPNFSHYKNNTVDVKFGQVFSGCFGQQCLNLDIRV